MKPRMSLTDSAYKRIKGWILSGQIPPNSQIEEQEIARRLSMSRTPVREALLRLKGESLIDIQRGKGIRVLSLSGGEMAELYQIITGLESLAAYLTAKAGKDRAGLAPMFEAVEEMERTFAAGEIDEWGEADERFHRSLFKLSGNKRLLIAGIQHRDITQRAHLVAARLQSQEYRGRSTEAHRALAELIAAGKADEAREIHFAQRMRGEEALLSVLVKYGILSL